MYCLVGDGYYRMWLESIVSCVESNMWHPENSEISMEYVNC